MTFNAIQPDLNAAAREHSSAPSGARTPREGSGDGSAADASRRDSALDQPEGFSFALAAATVQTQAARALETHGAKPTGIAQGAAKQKGASSDAPRQVGADVRASAQSPAGRDALARPEPPASGGAYATAAGVVQAPPPVGVTAIAFPPSAAIATPLVAAPSFQSRTVIDPSATRDANIQRTAGLAAKTTARTSTPAAAAGPEIAAGNQAEFARLIARRAADGASEFELRLDPPHLGRIVGKLSIGEEGRTVVSLTFESAEAFDLFSRDADLLRETLTDAGLSVGSGDLSFLLARRDPQNNAAIAAARDNLPEITSEITTSREAAMAEAQFFASWSSGSVDLTI